MLPQKYTPIIGNKMTKRISTNMGMAFVVFFNPSNHGPTWWNYITFYSP